MSVINVRLDRLRKRESNPNVMDATRYRQLVAAIRRGFYQPLLVRAVGDDYEVIDGAHRYDAAKEVGLHELPCVTIEASDNEAAALQIAMNRLRGEVDLTSVAQIIADLRLDGFDVTLPGVLGFSLEELHILDDMAASDIGILTGGAAGDESKEAAPSPSTDAEGYTLEIVFSTERERSAAKRKLKKLGNGDLTAGLAALLR